MKILVIDDDPLHQASARETLVGHELTVVDTYDEACDLLQERRAPCDMVGEELLRRGFKRPYAQDTTKEERAASLAEEAKIEQEFLPPPSFDVVLSDLMMSASSRDMTHKGRKYVGQPMPVGFGLALMAVQHGAKYVAVVTDTNHHDHPAASMLEEFCTRPPFRGIPRGFMINGARVGYYASFMWQDDDDVLAGKCLDNMPKRWDRVLKNLFEAQ